MRLEKIYIDLLYKKITEYFHLNLSEAPWGLKTAASILNHFATGFRPMIFLRLAILSNVDQQITFSASAVQMDKN
jgi:hypothetical protein